MSSSRSIIPLSAIERKRLRAITSRATITSTRLVNTYEWGDLKADPHELVVKYFDAFLYCANWGTRRLILRVPSARLDLKNREKYCAIRAASSRRNRSVATVDATEQHLVIDLWSESESGDDWADVEPGLLSALAPIRNELIAGDYRALYVAWRLRAQAGELATNARVFSGTCRDRQIDWFAAGTRGVLCASTPRDGRASFCPGGVMLDPHLSG